ncbi:hypothetical protein P4E94_05395 [Pontiellaceae bacterium B12219]|nr:hypothetical protein [Pontiellaceae bacterium B12219]
MTEPKKTSSRRRHGLFIFAVAIYASGGLLFSLLSYCSHKTVLTNQADETLLETVRALQETYEMETATTDASDVEAYRQRLMPLRHGLSGALSIVEVTPNRCTVQVSVSNELNSFMEILENSPPPEDLQTVLLAMADEKQDATRLFTTTPQPFGTIRYAILYRAAGPLKGTAFLASDDGRLLEQQLDEEARRLTIGGFSMLVLAIPLILLVGQSKKRSSATLSKMNALLQRDMETQKIREEELKDAIADLERFNTVTTGRESRIIELKAEVNEQLRLQNKTPRYNIDKID